MTEEEAIPAGFWSRVAAALIDCPCRALFSGAIIVLLLLLNFLLGLFSSFSAPDDPMMAVFSRVFNTLSNIAPFISIFFVFCSDIIYGSVFESSSWQGTPGKRLLGLVVVDDQGNRLKFGRALVRNLAKLISNVSFGLGYLLIAITSQKQALHDFIASTHVVRPVAEVLPASNQVNEDAVAFSPEPPEPEVDLPGA